MLISGYHNHFNNAGRYKINSKSLSSVGLFNAFYIINLVKHNQNVKLLLTITSCSAYTWSYAILDWTSARTCSFTYLNAFSTLVTAWCPLRPLSTINAIQNNCKIGDITIQNIFNKVNLFF